MINKIILIIIITLSLFFVDLSYSQVTKTKYLVIDNYEKGFSTLFGAIENKIYFKLFELEDYVSNNKFYGVEIEITNKDTKVSSYSIALATIGSVWASNSSLEFQTTSEGGFIVLTYEDLDELISFFNEIIPVTSDKSNKNYRVYKLTINNSFEFGILFDEEWRFFISADNVIYELNYVEGIDVVRRLNQYYKRISEMQRQDN